MEAKTDLHQKPLKWFEIWRTAFLQPTVQTFTRIISDPKVGTKRGIIWAAITALIIWLIGPQRTLWSGTVSMIFGPPTVFYFVLIGTIAAPILGVLGLLIYAAMAHGLARLFNGLGTFHQLVYCWGIMRLPFILFTGLAFYLLPFSLSRFHLFSQLPSSTQRIIIFLSIFMAILAILYLLYAEVVAFSAVEKFGVEKGFGILFLLTLVIGIISAFLTYGLQALVMKSLRY